MYIKEVSCLQCTHYGEDYPHTCTNFSCMWHSNYGDFFDPKNKEDEEDKPLGLYRETGYEQRS